MPVYLKNKITTAPTGDCHEDEFFLVSTQFFGSTLSSDNTETRLKL